jgi:hypothetical protein
MTAAEVVRDRILAVSAATGLVGARVYTDLLPQSPTLPAVRVQRIDEFESAHLRGAGGPYRARVQVDAVATTLAGAFALDAAMHGDGAGSGLSGWSGNTSGSPAIWVWSILPIDVRDDYDAEELRQFRVMRDYWVRFSE